jgi:hypothetical protein
MPRQEIRFPGPKKYLKALGDDPGLAIVPYSMAAKAFGVTVPTVQSYVRRGRIREIIVGKRTWVGLAAMDVTAEGKRKDHEIASRVPGCRKILQSAARRGRTFEYADEIMEPLGLDHTISRDRHVIGHVLGRISTRTFREDGRMLSVLAVLKETERPNKAFFELARELGAIRPGESDEDFFQRELKAVIKHYGKPIRLKPLKRKPRQKAE